MKSTDKNINKLTHELMKEGQPIPSADLSARIMARIFQQLPAGMNKLVRVPLLPNISPALLLCLLVLYISSLIGGMYFINFQFDGIESFFAEIKEYVPYILTVYFMAVSLVFYSFLDKLIKHK